MLFLQAQGWVETFTFHIGKFELLTSLHLDKIPIHCKTVTSVLGNTCPQLKWLRIGFANFPFTVEDMLSLFYSGDLETLNQIAPSNLSTGASSEDIGGAIQPKKAYHYCHVPVHLMYPYCQTLEEIRINHFESNGSFIIAFVLRHLPRLRLLETSDFELRDYSTSIRALWDIRETEITTGVTDMTQQPPDYSDSIVVANFNGKSFVVIIPITFYLLCITNSIFLIITGTLALSSLFIEGDAEYLTLKSVCDLCPDLEKLHVLELNVSTPKESSENTITFSEISKDFQRLDKVIKRNKM